MPYQYPKTTASWEPKHLPLIKSLMTWYGMHVFCDGHIYRYYTVQNVANKISSSWSVVRLPRKTFVWWYRTPTLVRRDRGRVIAKHCFDYDSRTAYMVETFLFIKAPSHCRLMICKGLGTLCNAVQDQSRSQRTNPASRRSLWLSGFCVISLVQDNILSFKRGRFSQ